MRETARHAVLFDGRLVLHTPRDCLAGMLRAGSGAAVHIDSMQLLQVGQPGATMALAASNTITRPQEGRNANGFHA